VALHGSKADRGVCASCAGWSRPGGATVSSCIEFGGDPLVRGVLGMILREQSRPASGLNGAAATGDPPPALAKWGRRRHFAWVAASNVPLGRFVCASPARQPSRIAG
jgi:hypothetical protein